MSKDPALDAIKHIFGFDKNKEAQHQNEGQHHTETQQHEEAQQQGQAILQAPVEQAPSFTQPAPVEPFPAGRTPEEMPPPAYSPPQETEQPSFSQQQPAYSPPPAEQSQPNLNSTFGHNAEAAAVGSPSNSSGDVQQINGHTVGFAYLRYYQEHPEVGQPVDEQHGDVNGFQMFENAILHWDGQQINVEWRQGHEPHQNQSFSTASSSSQRTYSVQAGDSLWAIAERMYGDGNQWNRIFEANRDKISNPDMIHPGQELVIP